MKVNPLIVILIGFMLGILAGRHVPFDFTDLCRIVLILGFGFLWFSQRKIVSIIFLGCLFFVLGWIAFDCRNDLAIDDINNRQLYFGKGELSIQGVVSSDIQHKGLQGYGPFKTNFYCDVKEVKRAGQSRKVRGTILVQVFREVQLEYGDEVLLQGKLHYPHNFGASGNFSYIDYLSLQGVKKVLSVRKDLPIEISVAPHKFSLRSLAYKLRGHLKKVFDANFTPNEAAIMNAFLLGDRSEIPTVIKDLFVRTGTVHILAISGFNVSIVAGLFLIFLKMGPLRRKIQLIITILLLIFYAFMTGLSPSVVRSTIMMTVFLFGFIFEREVNALNSLAFAALLILFFDPRDLWDVGFQLSFICVLSIILLYPIFLQVLSKFQSERRLKSVHDDKSAMAEAVWGDSASEAGPNLNFIDKVMDYFYKSFVLSLAVWVGVAGLILYYFNIVTPITVLANLFVIPVSSILVILGFGMLLVSQTIPILTVHCAVCIKILLNVLVGGVFIFDKIPGAHFYVKEINVSFVSVYYVALGTIYLLFNIFFLKIKQRGDN